MTRLERGEDNVPLCAINRLQRPDIQGYTMIYDDDKLYDDTHWNTIIHIDMCIDLYIYICHGSFT